MSRKERRNYAAGREYRQKHRNGKGYRDPVTGPPVIDLTKVVPVPMNQLTEGRVVRARVPYSDCADDKPRPVVVVSRRGREVTVLPCTTRPHRRAMQDHVDLDDLAEAGLSRPTGVSRRPITLDRIDLIEILGSLSDRDEAAVFGRGLLKAVEVLVAV